MLIINLELRIMVISIWLLGTMVIRHWKSGNNVYQ